MDQRQQPSKSPSSGAKSRSEELAEHYAANPVSLKSWLQKLLVFALCALSFYAGWQARESSLVRNCLQAGGQVSHDTAAFSCQWSE